MSAIALNFVKSCGAEQKGLKNVAEICYSLISLSLAEEGILKDTDKTEGSIRHQDPPGVVNNTSNIARRANRCLQKAQQEADNSEDLPFVDRINIALRNLRPSK